MFESQFTCHWDFQPPHFFYVATLPSLYLVIEGKFQAPPPASCSPASCPQIPALSAYFWPGGPTSCHLGAAANYLLHQAPLCGAPESGHGKCCSRGSSFSGDYLQKKSQPAQPLWSTASRWEVTKAVEGVGDKLRAWLQLPEWLDQRCSTCRNLVKLSNTRARHKK